MYRKSNTQWYVVLITLVVTLGGLLFGYDTAVIAGVIEPLRMHFVLTATQMGFVAASALLGCVIGAMIAGKLAQKLSRREILKFAAIFFVASALGSALAPSYALLVLFRIACGVGIGISSMVSPMYIAEVAPAKFRGKLVGMNQFAIILGMLVIYFVNYLIAKQGDATWLADTGWRWMFASGVIPSLLFLGLLFFVPRSPRWLMMNNHHQDAINVLKKIYLHVDDMECEMTKIKQSVSNKLEKIKLSKYSKILIIGVLLSIFQQVTGINVFLYYAPIIFKSFNHGTMDVAMLQTILVGAVNLLFTVIAMYTVDKMGRRPLMMLGALGMGVCITTIGTAAYFGDLGSWLLIFILGYIACFALSLGPVTWVLLAEIFPNQIRSRALAIAVAIQWLANFAVSQSFPMMNDPTGFLFKLFHGAFPFWLYGAMCMLTLWFTYRFIPETKGKSLEEIEEVIKQRDPINTHPVTLANHSS